MSKLALALQVVTKQLRRFAVGSSYWNLMGEVFGVGEGQPAAHAIQAQLSQGRLDQLARVEVISAALLEPAHAAYAGANGTIYLSDRFVAEASQTQLQTALLEEFGQAIDTRVNATDRPGDEGELFSLRVRGITPTAPERQRILAEDDRRLLTINGVPLAVEQAAPVVYETTTITGSSTTNTFLGIVLSGLNASWREKRNALSVLKFSNGATTSTIATSPYRSFGSVAISGGTVAYTKNDGQDDEVYRYSGGTTVRLTDNSGFDGNVLIDGNTIVWQGQNGVSLNGEIFRNNGTTTTRITTNDVKEEDVQLSGAFLLWAASDGSDYEIYLNNGTTTQALTNNTLEDYSPVLKGNRAAWFQWKNDEENLFFYNGTTAAQVTTNLDVFDPMIVGGNLLYKQRAANGSISLKLYNATSLATTTLSSRLGSENVQTSGPLVAWLEANSGDGGSSALSSIKLFNGISTKTIAINAIGNTSSGSFIYSSSSFILNGSKVVYIGQPSDSTEAFQGELFLYDNANPRAGSTQITVGERLFRDDLDQAQVVGNRILWASNGELLKLSQPTTKPILSFATSALTVVEGFSSPLNATLTVSLSAVSGVPVTVNYETFTRFSDANPAFDGSDYTRTTGTLTFAAGVTSKTINIPILNDSFSEPDETFYVRLLAPGNAVLAPGATTATITITDTLKATGPAGQTFTLPAGVENLTLTGVTNINGTGNADRNTIRGNSANNRLDGGGGGSFDELIGGLGDDVYVVDGRFFTVPAITENPGEGVDTVEYFSDAGFGGYTLGDNLDNLRLTGTSSSSGTGNALNNTIRGNSGDNFLNGGAGIDTVSYEDAPGPSGVTVSLSSPFGGFGSASGWGSDTVTGFENIIGSSFADTLSGDDSANSLTGNAGKDALTGGGGVDRFVYRTLSHSLLASFDRIIDFNASVTGDRLLVSTARAGFINGGQVTTQLTDASLTAAAISTKLTKTNFQPNFAATVTMGSGLTSRAFVVINDNVAGFSAASDAVIEITGFTGTFGAGQFVTS